jgi:hypothetical protein
MMQAGIGEEGTGVNGLLTDDERRVLGAAHQLGLVLSSDWPDVAAHLLAQGADGEATSELAGLPRTASPWSVDQLGTSEPSDIDPGLLRAVSATWF